MEFRILTEKDVPACTHTFIEIFNDELWNDKWTFERAKQYISDYYYSPNFLGVCAIEQGEMIGFAYGVQKTWWVGNEFYIHEMGVKKRWRGQGIGKALLEMLKKELEGSDVRNFALLTDRGVPAELFYKKYGFQEIERLVFYSCDF